MELVLHKVEGSDDLLARLKAIQKSEAKEFNNKDSNPEQSDLDKVTKTELTLSDLLSQLGILF